MKKKELTYAVGGLILGFLLGVILIGSSDSLRTDLFGTAADSGNHSNPEIDLNKLTFYEVKFGDAEDWLNSVDPEAGQQLQTDLDNVNGLGTADNIGTYYTGIQDSVQNVLQILHSTLLDGADMQAPDLNRFSTCIALNNDPYSGPGVYVYLQVPNDVAADVPADWTPLSGPKEQNMLYSTTCISDNNGESG